MVVILLLTPCTCSRSSSSHAQAHLANTNQPGTAHSSGQSSSPNSNNASSASTGDTAIPTSQYDQRIAYNLQQQQQQHPRHNQHQHHQPSHSHNNNYNNNNSSRPKPPVHRRRTSGWHTSLPANFVPKPPRGVPAAPYIFHINGGVVPQLQQQPMFQHQQPLPKSLSLSLPMPANCTNTTTTDIVRHVTRVNFYDIDTSQVEFEPKDDDDNEAIDCDTEATTKEEEWITKRKTELTTTRQIETRVKRQLKLQDGKVIEDTGPIVSTNTTEDTDKQESETTEKRDLGLLDDIAGKPALTSAAAALVAPDAGKTTQLAPLDAVGAGGTLVKRMVPRPADGLVRQIDDKRVISHEEIKDYHETEDIKHLGDVTDETYVNAVREGVEDLEAALCSPASQKQLLPLGPKVIANTSKSRKTIDSEGVQKRCLAQEDGTLVTESKKTTEHELIVDEELPEKDEGNFGGAEQITTTQAANQRYFKQRDEQHVDLIADGKVVGTEMRYAAETMQMDKDGSLERPGDWDSLSDRMRKLRRSQQQKEVALLADRKDALTKRPLDFDREEETRKGETMKWLESHFGSESTASNDSRDDNAEVEPTKKSYFNVTIKSQSQALAQPGQLPTLERQLTNMAASTLERKNLKEKSKYFQGVSNWTERKEPPNNHFSTQAFREDLQETIRRNGLKKKISGGSTEKIPIGRSNAVDARLNDTYVSSADIIQQKRQSLSSQFLAKSARGSRDALDDLDAIPAPAPASYQMGSVTLHRTEEPSHKRIAYSSSNNLINDAAVHQVNMHSVRAKSYERTLDSNAKPLAMDYTGSSSNLSRPTVPQRRRAIEKKLTEQHSHEPVIKTTTHLEPPPDYSPPLRSRSSSPQVDYLMTRQRLRQHEDVERSGEVVSTLTRKQQQRTRFAPSSSYPSSHNGGVGTDTLRPGAAYASTSNISAASASKPSKMGEVIGNSLRKLISKIRSASAERKFRMKHKSREQAPPVVVNPNAGTDRNLTTYQQYNVIDGHIGDVQESGRNSSNESKGSNSDSQRRQREPLKPDPHSLYVNSGVRSFKRAESSDPQLDQAISPRQRYYLGEDPYSSTLYGKENMYERNVRQRQRSTEPQRLARLPNEDEHYRARPPPTTTTLGRFQKHGQRFAGSTPNLHIQQDYRSVQTLPRKLHEHTPYRQAQQSPVSRPHYGRDERDRRAYMSPAKLSPPQQPALTAFKGPTKPARTYAKTLNRSKSFNVHGINGSNDPSPIYIEKLTKNNYTNGYIHPQQQPAHHYASNLQASQAYKSNPHLFSNSKDNSLKSGLKSPSIVNLISRSQKDLTKIGNNDLDPNQDDKKQVYLRGLHQQAPELYRAIHGDENYGKSHKYPLQQKYSLDSRSPVDLNKDTASIVRRSDGGYADLQLLSNKRHIMYNDDLHESRLRRGSGAGPTTVIEVRSGSGYRK